MLKPLILYRSAGQEFELGYEHGSNAVESCGGLFLNGEECCFRVEGLGGEEDSRPVGCSRHVAEDAAEAVEEGWWTADYVFGCELHAFADEITVVED